nr:hypothetical protein [Saprospiraceae bacterium]
MRDLTLTFHNETVMNNPGYWLHYVAKMKYKPYFCVYKLFRKRCKIAGMKSLFKTQSHLKFQYLPRFYDERKEDLDDVVAQHNPDEEIDAERIKSRVLRRMRSRYYSQSPYAKKAMLRSRILVFILAGLLMVIAILILGYFPELTDV